jgi:hypothetical protein
VWLSGKDQHFQSTGYTEINMKVKIEIDPELNLNITL